MIKFTSQHPTQDAPQEVAAHQKLFFCGEQVRLPALAKMLGESGEYNVTVALSHCKYDGQQLEISIETLDQKYRVEVRHYTKGYDPRVTATIIYDDNPIYSTHEIDQVSAKGYAIDEYDALIERAIEHPIIEQGFTEGAVLQDREMNSLLALN